MELKMKAAIVSLVLLGAVNSFAGSKKIAITCVDSDPRVAPTVIMVPTKEQNRAATHDPVNTSALFNGDLVIGSWDEEEGLVNEKDCSEQERDNNSVRFFCDRDG